MSVATKEQAIAGLRRFTTYPAYKDSGVEWLGDIPAHGEASSDEPDATAVPTRLQRCGRSRRTHACVTEPRPCR